METRTKLVSLSESLWGVNGNHGLPEAQASIATGYFALCEYMESVDLQALAKAFRQIHVIERPPAETNTIQAASIAQYIRDFE